MQVPLSRPILGNQRCLLQHRLGGFLLLIGRVTVFAHDPFHHDPQFGGGSLPYCPIDRHVIAHSLDRFAGNAFERFVAQDLHRAVVHIQPITSSRSQKAQSGASTRSVAAARLFTLAGPGGGHAARVAEPHAEGQAA